MAKTYLIINVNKYYSNFGGASSSNHGGIFIAKFDELLSKLILLCTSSRIGREEQSTRRDSASKPLSRGKLGYDCDKLVLDFTV